MTLYTKTVEAVVVYYELGDAGIALISRGLDVLIQQDSLRLVAGGHTSLPTAAEAAVQRARNGGSESSESLFASKTYPEALM